MHLTLDGERSRKRVSSVRCAALGGAGFTDQTDVVDVLGHLVEEGSIEIDGAIRALGDQDIDRRDFGNAFDDCAGVNARTGHLMPVGFHDDDEAVRLGKRAFCAVDHVQLGAFDVDLDNQVRAGRHTLLIDRRHRNGSVLGGNQEGCVLGIGIVGGPRSRRPLPT